MISETLIQVARRLGGGPEGFARALLTHRAAAGAEPSIAPALHFYSGTRIGVTVLPPTFTPEAFHEVIDQAITPVRVSKVGKVLLVADSNVNGQDCVVAFTWTPEGFSGRRWPYRIVDQTVIWGEPVISEAAQGAVHDLILAAFAGQKGLPLELGMAALAGLGYETEVLP